MLKVVIDIEHLSSNCKIRFDEILARVLSLIQTKVFKFLVKSHEGKRTKLQFHKKYVLSLFATYAYFA